MFKIEFFSLLKEIREATGQQRKQQLQSLLKLIQEHPQEYNEIEQQGLITEEVISLIDEAKSLEEENKPQNNNNEDFDKIKQAYSQWLQEYQQSGGVTTQNMAKIVEELVQFYAPQRFEVINQMLNIKDSDEFEKFKLHIKNRLRAYYAEKIEEYMSSSNYTSLSFLKKYKKNKQLRKLLTAINNYEFNPKSIAEVLQ